MSKQIDVTEENYKKLQAALLLTGEEEQTVIRKLIDDYAHKAFESAMGQKPVQEVSTTPPVVSCTPSSAEQKRLFVNWFQNLTRNGKAYKPVTISGYTGRIENACFNSAFSSVPVKNLFTITDYARFLDVQKQIKSCDGYNAFDAESHGGFTAALRKYAEFLSIQNGCATAQGYQTTARPYYQPATAHRWTMEEDQICCKRFLEFYVIQKSNMDAAQFLQMLAKEVPSISAGSLRMKIQNIKCLSRQAGLKDTSTFTWLSQYSMQNEREFKKALKELGIVKEG